MNIFIQFLVFSLVSGSTNPFALIDMMTAQIQSLVTEKEKIESSIRQNKWTVHAMKLWLNKHEGISREPSSADGDAVLDQGQRIILSLNDIPYTQEIGELPQIIQVYEKVFRDKLQSQSRDGMQTVMTDAVHEARDIIKKIEKLYDRLFDVTNWMDIVILDRERIICQTRESIVSQMKDTRAQIEFFYPDWEEEKKCFDFANEGLENLRAILYDIYAESLGDLLTVTKHGESLDDMTTQFIRLGQEFMSSRIMRAPSIIDIRDRIWSAGRRLLSQYPNESKRLFKIREILDVLSEYLADIEFDVWQFEITSKVLSDREEKLKTDLVYLTKNFTS